MIVNIKNKHCIEIASKLINDGEIIIYPTDTLYGFGVDATNRNAINNLNLLKKREQMYSIILHSISDIDNFAFTNQNKLDYINKIFPGPYTVILKSKKSSLSKLVNMNSGTIGIRIPKSNFILDVVKKINKHRFNLNIFLLLNLFEFPLAGIINIILLNNLFLLFFNLSKDKSKILFLKSLR